MAPSSSLGHLLVTNVQVHADTLLAKKGFRKMSDKADLAITMNREYESSVNQSNDKLRLHEGFSSDHRPEVSAEAQPEIFPRLLHFF